MKETLGRNEDVIFENQTERVIRNRGNIVNRQRRYVSAGAVIFWLSIALVALFLWALRLVGGIDLLR